ncbi:MAG: hygromycin-B 4-O-kinase [Patescibacteria group bacterium]|nr:hygromycin-B 4-O-kinase [Patescibacteria group bacterium]
MSTYKTVFDEEGASKLLAELLNESDIKTKRLKGGEGSCAFSFAFDNQKLVLRVNSNGVEGYEKDKFAYDNFSSSHLPIPKVIKIGVKEDGLAYVITEEASGITLDKLSKDEYIELAPKLVAVLDAINGVRLAGSGYGSWDKNGNAGYSTWQGYLKACITQEPIVDTPKFYNQGLHDLTAQKASSLFKYCPEERVLVHGDFGLDNTLCEGVNISSVIDWEGSLYGDRLRDIAWIDFWRNDDTVSKIYLKEHENDKDLLLNFKERLECYKLLIGLSALWFFAFSNQEKSYAYAQELIEKLLN